MGLVFGGLRAIASGAAALVGQVITALQFVSTQASGSDAFKVTTNGARWHIGAGASDYLSSDGTIITAAGPFASASSVTGSSLTASGASGVSATLFVAPSGSSANLKGQLTNGTGAVVGNFNAVAGAGTKVVSFVKSNTTEVANITADGAYNPDFTDDSANPGNRTVDKPAGQSAIAIGAATCVITNAVVKATSVVFCVLQFGDATATTILRVVPAAGSFTITVNAAATAATKFGWVVFNGV